jgi:hypothetical protein
MTSKEDQHPLLKKPLYIFSLPPEILNTITLKGEAVNAQVSAIPRDEERKQINGQGTTTSGVGCATCNIASFTDMEEQREHVRSDLHKFNLKRKVAGHTIVNADEFDKMLEGTACAGASLTPRSE